MTISEHDAFTEMALFVRSFQFTKMLQIAADIDLADRIAERPKLVAELAGECGVNAAMLLRLCRALSAYGVFALDAAGILSQTSRSAWLRRNSKPTLYYTVRYWGMPSTWAAWGNLDHTIRTGEPAFEAELGMPMFEYLRAHPNESRVFDLFMEHSPDDRHRAVVETYRRITAGPMLRLDAHQSLHTLPVRQGTSSSPTLPPSSSQSEILRDWSASKRSLTPAPPQRLRK